MSDLTDLLHRASQLVEESYHKANPDGITPRQALTLNYIQDHPGCSQTDIVESTGIDRSTLADIVRRLERRGFLSRKRSKEDARAYQVTLTVPGAKALKDAEKASSATEQAALSKLPVSKQKALVASLHDLIDVLEDKGEVKEAA